MHRPELFATIFDRYFHVVARFAAGRVGFEAAADVAGDTFLRAFDRRDRFQRERPSALPWLLGIALNVSREHRRAAQRRYRLYQPVSSDPEFETASAERVDAERIRPDLAEALRGLSDDEYAILMLAAVGDLSYPDIATSLGIPIGTVRSRLHRARRRMRELLADTRPITADDGSHARLI